MIIAEFNYQHTFRDRLSSLESIIAAAQRIENIKFIVLYEKEFENHLKKLRQQYKFDREIAFPVNEEKMQSALSAIK